MSMTTISSSLTRVARLGNAGPSQSRVLTRFMSGRQGCANKGPNECGDAKLSKKPCDKTDKKKKTQFQSMWYNPECCNDPCPDFHPRYDELYYRISDKAKRIYEKTWVDCPKLYIAPRKICCYEQVDLPIKKRKKQDCPKTACKDLCPPTSGKCPRVRAPGCKSARSPPKCVKTQHPSDCKKVCTPYPSFSECSRPPSNKRRVAECGCLFVPMMCEVWAEMRRLQSFK